MKEDFEQGARNDLFRPLDEVVKQTRLEPLGGVCVKSVLVADSKSIDRLKREVKAMASVDHPALIKLVASDTDEIH